MHCVDLGESFPTRIYLQNLASIQLRTIVNYHFVPLRYLQFLKIVRSTAAAAAEKETSKVCDQGFARYNEDDRIPSWNAQVRVLRWLVGGGARRGDPGPRAQGGLGASAGSKLN